VRQVAVTTSVTHVQVKTEIAGAAVREVKQYAVLLAGELVIGAVGSSEGAKDVAQAQGWMRLESAV